MNRVLDSITVDTRETEIVLCMEFDTGDRVSRAFPDGATQGQVAHVLQGLCVALRPVLAVPIPCEGWRGRKCCNGVDVQLVERDPGFLQHLCIGCRDAERC